MNNNTLTIVVVLLVLALGGYWLMNRPSEDAKMDTVDQPSEESKVLEVPMVTIILSAVEGSEVTQTGTAVLKESEDGLVVTVDVSGYETDVPQPMHIHIGGCPGVGDVAYGLESLMNGTSTTVLDGVTIDQLSGELPLAINVHKSADEVSIYTACGDVSL